MMQICHGNSSMQRESAAFLIVETQSKVHKFYVKNILTNTFKVV